MSQPEAPTSISPSPDLTSDQVQSMLRAVYDLDGVVSHLPGEVDDNWRVVTGTTTYRVRISRPGVPASSVAVEIEALAAAEHMEIATPTVVPTRTGEPLSSTEDGRVIRVLTWVHGEAYATIGRSPALDHSIGRCAAQMVQALAGVDGTHLGDVPWNLIDSTRFVQSRTHAIANPYRRSLVEAAARDVEMKVHTRNLPRAVIHNDLNDFNVFVDGGEVTGVIDFGDLTRTYRVAELAIAATYAMFGRRDPLAAAERVVGSFVEVMDLTSDEAASIFDLIRARLAMSVSQAASRLHTENAHQQVSSVGAWDLIERLNAADRSWCTQLLARAAGHPG